MTSRLPLLAPGGDAAACPRFSTARCGAGSTGFLAEMGHGEASSRAILGELRVATCRARWTPTWLRPYPEITSKIGARRWSRFPSGRRSRSSEAPCARGSSRDGKAKLRSRPRLSCKRGRKEPMNRLDGRLRQGLTSSGLTVSDGRSTSALDWSCDSDVSRSRLKQQEMIAPVRSLKPSASKGRE